MSGIRFKFSGVVSSNCSSVVPNLSSCVPECCAPMHSKCQPMVPMRDYNLVKPRAEESCFTLGVGACSTEVVHAARNCIQMHIRRRGDCLVLLKLAALRATLEGAACFSWPVEFWRLTDGEFEGDIYVNGKTCLTVGLRMQGCSIALLAYSQTEGLLCGLPQDACVAPIDDTPVALPTSVPCETC
ncbi:MAG: hypothetical protein RL260_2739 [Pseudomonadota bacterium]